MGRTTAWRGCDRASGLRLLLLLATAVATGALGFLGGCGSGHPNGAAAVDAGGAGDPPGDAGDLAFPGDGGAWTLALGDASGDAGVLQAQLQIDGAHTPCGGCAVLAVQAQGGTPPYRYAWSDPALTGPGPHTVCPTGPVHYAVTVTDGSGTTSGEFSTPAQQVNVAGDVSCAAGAPDAGGGLLGCAQMTYSPGDAGSLGDSGVTECTAEEVDGSVAWAQGGPVSVAYAALPAPFLAGHPYSANMHRLLPISLSLADPPIVEVWGAKSVCAPGEMFYSQPLGGGLDTWNQTFCFTPHDDYAAVVVKVFIKGVLFYADLSLSGSMCSSCDK